MSVQGKSEQRKNEQEESVVVKMVEAQEKVFQAWKEAMAEYNNNKLLEIFGEETCTAWENYLDLQEKAFGLWKEAVLTYQPYMAQAFSGQLAQNSYRQWWDLQEKMMRSWKESVSSDRMWDLFHYQNWLAPEKAMGFYRQWMEMMQESIKKTPSKEQKTKQPA